MIDISRIGKQIKIARIEQGMTQEQISELVGISPAHLSNIECGRKFTTLETFIELVKTLNLSMDKLLCYEPNMPMQKNILSNNISRLFEDCTASELIILEEAIKQIKCAIRASNNNTSTKD